MPDREAKTKQDEKEIVKLKERKYQRQTATKRDEIERVNVGTQDVSLQQQLSLFHFYKKKVHDPDCNAHTSRGVRADDEIEISANALTNSEADRTLTKDDGLRISSPLEIVVGDDMDLPNTCLNSEMLSDNWARCDVSLNTSYQQLQTGTRANLGVSSNVSLNGLTNASSTSSNTDIFETITLRRSMNQSTDVNLTTQGQSNTIAYSVAPFKPKDQDILTQWAVPHQLSSHSSFTSQKPHCPSPVNRPPLEQHPSQLPLFLSPDSVPFPSYDSDSLIANSQLESLKEFSGADASEQGDVVKDISNLRYTDRTLDNEHSLGKAVLYPDSYYNTEVKLLPSTPKSKSVFEQASEHGGEKVSRHGYPTIKEASEPICTALSNINVNSPGVKNVDAINRSIFTPDRLIEGESISIPIDLTASPMHELGPLIGIVYSPPNRYEFISFCQGDPRFNEVCVNEIRTIASRGELSSLTPGNQLKPIEILSPVSPTAQLLSSSSKGLRKSTGTQLQIHPFFRKIITPTTLTTPINSSWDSDKNVDLDLNSKLASSNHLSQNSGTTRPAASRSHVRKGKGNKDKSGDEVQCNITDGNGNESTDVILSRVTSEKNHSWNINSISPIPSNSVPLNSRTFLVPWPNNENQHVPRYQKLERKPFTLYRRMKRAKQAEETKIEGLVGLKLNYQYAAIFQEHSRVQTLPQISSNSAIRHALTTIPSEHEEHPGIARVISVIKQKETGAKKNMDIPLCHSMWTTKWKPRRAAEVLGNESQAFYLREWLKALSIQDRKCPVAGTTKHKERGSSKHKRKRKAEEKDHKRVVIRSIAKGKRRRIGSDEDDDEDESWIVADEDIEIYGDVNGDTDDWLSDAGKSRGDNLSSDHENLENEFSKRVTNTILIAGKPGTGKTSAVYACAEELGWEIFEVYPGIGKRTGVNISESIGNVGKNHIVGKGIRQSIILLEEVDILFKEDVNFWTSVVNIISTSHRPVILTCNDASSIPQNLLPLQKCLKFDACPCGLALSFLQAVCIAEGFNVTRKRVEEEYALIGGDEPEWPPSVAFPSEALPAADLRSALNRLQMGLRFSVSQDEYLGNGTEWRAGEHTLEDCELYTETASYVDAYLDQIEQKHGYETQGDDEIGYTMLTNLDDMQKVAFNYSMAYDVLACCRHVVNGPSTKCESTQTPSKHRWLIQTRRLLAQQAASFLDEIINLPGPLLPHHEAVLEYVPAVKWIVALDDAQSMPHLRRRWKHVRHLDLSKEALSAVREYYDMFFPRCIM